MYRLLIVLALGAGCGKNNEPPPPSSGSPNAQTESGPRSKKVLGPAERARGMFDTICAQCHGADGTGTGPGAANLDPKPRNYTDAAWQASVTDDDLKKVITLGGKAVGKSMFMPPNPGLDKDPEELAALVQIIRNFGKK